MNTTNTNGDSNISENINYYNENKPSSNSEKIPLSKNPSNEPVKVAKPLLDDVRFFFGNCFGIIPDMYVKYYNLVLTEILCTLFFTLIYYYLLLDFHNNYWVPPGFNHAQFLENRLFYAFNMSLQFQTTTAYVTLNCKSLASRIVIIFQLFATFIITFTFLYI